MRTVRGEEVAAAVSSRVVVPRGAERQLEFCLAWDSPKVVFGAAGREHARYYTRHWREADGPVGPRLCDHALAAFPAWEEAIEAWQEPALSDSALPDWLKSAVFNELYYLADGGSVWLEPDPGEALPQDDFRTTYGRWVRRSNAQQRMELHLQVGLPGVARVPNVQHLRRALLCEVV
jgi:non-lysosomal glucosylceramidase